MSSYRFYAGGGGRRFAYASSPTYRCPISDELTAAEGSPTPILDELEGAMMSSHETVDGMLDLRKALRRAHRSTGAADPPNVCPSCGAEMTNAGYRSWIEATLEDELVAASANESTIALNRRLGATHLHVPGSTRYWPKKREAIAWAREESEIDKTAAREEARS